MEYLPEESSPVDNTNDFSVYDENEVHFKFSIYKFLYQSNCIFYPELLQPEDEPSPWQLELNCSRELPKAELMRLQFNLWRADSQMYSVQVHMDIQVFNCVQDKIFEHSYKSIVTARSKSYDLTSSVTFFAWLHSNLFLIEDLGLEINIRIRDVAPNNIEMSKKYKKRLWDKYNRSVLQTDFKHGFAIRNFTDVELQGADGSAFAHKYILCCRSSIFQKVLMEAEGTKIIKMTKRSKNELEVFLEYLYTGLICTTDIDTLIAMYEMAIDYEVPSLRDEINRMSLENASKIF